MKLTIFVSYNFNSTAMQSLRQLFLHHMGQTSPSPLLIEIESAEGIYMYAPNGKRYVDLIAGVSVSNVGHRHPKVVQAIKNQVDKYMHLMVYGEYVQSPQVLYAEKLTHLLPEPLSSIYYVNSGSEANEGALKLAKRYTGRTEIIGFKHAYHGGTHGVLSLMGSEEYKNAFRPLLPDVHQITFNSIPDLQHITTKTACVIVEPMQGEGGCIVPENNYLQHLRNKCDETGTLLIFDEIQTGFGRLGTLFAFEKYGIVPDILTIAKAMGGGMPVGGFVSSREIMSSLTHNPVLGHITTFGGHPVSCAAALASLEVLIEENLIQQVDKKSALFRHLLKDANIVEIRGEGLLLAVDLGSGDRLQAFIKAAFENGIATDWFLFCNSAFRIAPPLNISDDQIKDICSTLVKIINNV